MRHAYLALIGCSCLCLPTASAAAVQWIENPVRDDGFYVEVPANAECSRTEREQPTFDGRRRVHRYSWTTPAGLEVGVQWYDLPAGAPAGFDVWRTRLAEARGRGIDVVRISGEEKSSEADGSAPVYYVDMRTELAEGRQIGRAYRTGGRVYLVFGRVPKDAADAEMADVVTFVQSFGLLP
jgi:hypothetical protein